MDSPSDSVSVTIFSYSPPIYLSKYFSETVMIDKTSRGTESLALQV